MGFKTPGEVIVLLGENTEELGASEYLWRVHGLEAGHPPRLDLERERAVQAAIRELIQRGWVHTAHDVADGGLLVALAEMTFPYGLGATVELRDELRPDALLFGEAASRVLFTVDKLRLQDVTAWLEAEGLPHHVLGEVGGDHLEVLLPSARLSWGVAELREAWERPLREILG